MKNERGKKLCTSLIILLFIGLVIVDVRVGSSQSLPLIYVDPPTYTAISLGEVFTINVNIANVSNLLYVKFWLGYNTTILDATNVTEGPFLKAFGYTFFYKEIHDDLGYVLVDTGVSGPAEGSGTLATITFVATYYGSVSCTLDLYNTTLRDSDTQPIDHEVADGNYEFTILYLSVTTDKEWYAPRDVIDIHGTLKQDGTYIDGLVALEIKNPEEETIALRTLQTGINPPDANVTIIDLYPCDSQAIPKYNFYRGTRAYFNVTVKNNDIITRIVTITVNTYYSNNVSFGVAVWHDVSIPANTTASYIPGIPIPTSAETGTGRVYASAFTDMPSLGGVAYCTEKSATFNIVGSGGGGASTSETQKSNVNSPAFKGLADPIGSYSLTFRLPLLIGNYTVYVNSNYQILYANNETTFIIKKLADINGDGFVDGLDLAILGLNWYT